MKDERLLTDEEYGDRLIVISAMLESSPGWGEAVRHVEADRLARIDEAARLRALLSTCMSVVADSAAGISSTLKCQHCADLLDDINAELGLSPQQPREVAHP